MYQIDNSIKMYNIDLNMTNECNMSCKYCFEPKNNKGSISEETVDIFINWMKNDFLKSEFFFKNYQMVNIDFWGGEPTLKHKEIKKIVDSFKNDSRIRFFIYSNGYDLSKIRDLLLNYRNKKAMGNHPKICIQVSYDGIATHDKYRVSKSDEPTSGKVLSSIRWLNVYEIPYVVKSVIKPEDFDFMYENYLDIRNLTYDDSPTFFKSQNYFPTIEYYNSENYDEQEVKIHISKLHSALKSILIDEIINITVHGSRPFFSWFSKNKAICGAGQHYIAIDYDGKVYPCHGCFYSKRSEHLIADINYTSSINLIEDKSKIFQEDNKYIPKECEECDALFCMRCNVVKYKNSDKKDYFDMWRDYANQPLLCRYNKEISKFIKIFKKKVG